MKKNKVNFIVQAAVIAALYVVLTFLAAALGISSGVIQCRLSEALSVLPAFLPAAIPGLFVGCLIANITTGAVIFDVVFGSIATLVGAVGTYFVAKKSKRVWLYPIPTVVANTVIVPFVLKYAYGFPDAFWFIILTVLAGELISAEFLGTLLGCALKKRKII